MLAFAYGFLIVSDSTCRPATMSTLAEDAADAVSNINRQLEKKATERALLRMVAVCRDMEPSWNRLVRRIHFHDAQILLSDRR